MRRDDRGALHVTDGANASMGVGGRRSRQGWRSRPAQGCGGGDQQGLAAGDGSAAKPRRGSLQWAPDTRGPGAGDEQPARASGGLRGGTEVTVSRARDPHSTGLAAYWRCSLGLLPYRP